MAGGAAELSGGTGRKGAAVRRSDGSSPTGGRADVWAALNGDNTWVHGVGDGLPSRWRRSSGALSAGPLPSPGTASALALTPGGADRQGLGAAGEPRKAGWPGWWPNQPGGTEDGASAAPVGRLSGEPARTDGLCHRKASHGSGAVEGGHRIEVAWSMVDDPHAGIKVLAGQSRWEH